MRAVPRQLPSRSIERRHAAPPTFRGWLVRGGHANRRLTCDDFVTYCGRHGPGVQGTCRSHPAEPARRALPRGWADAERARRALLDVALRRDAAPAIARGGRPDRHPATRPREAPLPEPGPDPARPRPVGEQVRRALGECAQRPQEQTGASHGKGVRDLHQDDPGAPLAGDHRSRDPGQVQLRRSPDHGLDASVRPTSWARRMPRLRSARA